MIMNEVGRPTRSIKFTNECCFMGRGGRDKSEKRGELCTVSIIKMGVFPKVVMVFRLVKEPTNPRGKQ